MVSVVQKRRDCVHDGERSAPASLLTSSLKANVNEKIRKNRRFTNFNYMYIILPGGRLKNDRETKDVQNLLTGFAVTFLDERIQKLVPRHDEYCNVRGDCVD